MAKAEVFSGICGFATTVVARMDGAHCVVDLDSDCEAIKSLATELDRVDPFREFTFQGQGPVILELARQRCKHAACPVPVAIIKAVEVAAGLALPKDVVIKLSKE